MRPMVRYSLVMFAGFLSGGAAHAGSWAEALFDGNHKDFGSVPRGPELTHNFRIKNTTGQVVGISGARVSCNICSSVSVGKYQLQPGEETALVETEAFTIDFVQSRFAIQSVAVLGRPSVAHATAVGKVFLAYGGETPAGNLRRFTERTITDRGELRREVESVRERGWARVLGEREEGLNAVAAPIWDSRGELAAILGIQGPAARFDDGATAQATPPLLARATAISNEIGGNGEPGRI